jgi:hypothetical protein
MYACASRGVLTAGIVAVLFAGAARAVDAIPDFGPNGGVGWVAQGAEFLPPASGAGPVMNDPAHPRISNAQAAATGKQPTFHVGDANSPILQPWAKEAVKKRADAVLAGKPGYTRQASCWPNGVPAFLLYPVQPIFIWQGDKEVLLVSQEDHQVRHVYMNVSHSVRVPLSWHGESVGRYEGDTLVVDTIGLNDQVFIDNYRTPHTDKLHVVERFRMADGGKTMVVDLHVEDEGAFTTPWNAVQRYTRVQQDQIRESFCAEGNYNYFNLDVEPIPQAKGADF